MSKAGVVQPNTNDSKPGQNNGISQQQTQNRPIATPHSRRPTQQQGQQSHISQPILPQHAQHYPLSPYTAGMSKRMDFDPNAMAQYGQAMSSNPYMSQQAPQQLQPQSTQVNPSAARKRRLQEPQGVISPQATSVGGVGGVGGMGMPQPQELIPGETMQGQGQIGSVVQPPPKKSRTNTPWTAAEEQRLKTMREAGNNWAEIAKTFPSRTEGSVKKHWYKDMHYAEFAEDESAALQNAIKEYEANKWKVIGQKVGKPAKACEQYAKEHFGLGATAKS